MRHLFALVVSATVAALSLLGCGSDSDGGSPNVGGPNGGSPNGGSSNGGSSNGGGSGGSAPTQCVGNNAEFTQAEFLAQTLPGKACSSATDASAVCANDMPLIGGQCGKGCLGMSGEAECVAACIQDALSPESLTEDCLACYTADIDCAKAHCLASCGLNPTGEACFACRTDNGCVDSFYACSGLPEPGGGSGGSGGDGG